MNQESSVEVCAFVGNYHRLDDFKVLSMSSNMKSLITF